MPPGEGLRSKSSPAPPAGRGRCVPGHDVGGAAQKFGGGLGRAGADAGDQDTGRQGRHAQRGDEVLHRGGASEGHDVNRPLRQPLPDFLRPRPVHHVLIRRDGVHDGPPNHERLHHPLIALQGAGEQDVPGLAGQFLGQRRPGLCARLEVGPDPIDAQGISRGGADGGDGRGGQGAGVTPKEAESVKKGVDSGGRGETDPVVTAQTNQSIVQGGIAVRRRHDVDQGKLYRLRAARPQQGGELGRLLAGAGDDDALAGQRPHVVPAQRLAQRHHIAHNGDGGRLKLRLPDLLHDVPQRPRQRLLPPRPRPPAHQGHGGGWVTPIVHQLKRNLLQVLHAHQKQQRVGGVGNFVPPAASFRLAGRARPRLARVVPLMPRDDGKRRSKVTVRHRDARIGRRGDGRRDAGDDNEGDAALPQVLRLLAAAPEHERVAALQPRHALPLLRPLGEQGIDVILPHGVPVRLLADVDALGVGPGIFEQRRVRQPVIHHDIGGLEGLHAADRDQFRVARSGPDELDDSCHAATVPS